MDGLSAWAQALLPLRMTVFLVLLACYLYFYMDPRLVFWNHGGMFLLNFRFLRDFMASAGRPCEWAGELLLQPSYYGWPGVLVATTLAWLLFILTAGLMRGVAHRRVHGTWVIPAILVTVLYSDFAWRMPTIIGLALAVAVAGFYVRVPLRSLGSRLPLFLLMSLVVYYAAGPAYYVLAACCLIYEAVTARRLVLAAAILLAAAGVKFGLDAILPHIDRAYLHAEMIVGSRLFRREDSQEKALQAVATVLYFYLPACALFVAARPAATAWVKRLARRTHAAKGRQEGSKAERAEVWDTRRRPERLDAPADAGRGGGLRVMRAAVRWVLITLLVLAPAGAAALIARDGEMTAFLELDYCAAHGMWNEVLEKAGRLAPELYSEYVNHDINLALYHTGRLPYDLFKYPQLCVFIPPESWRIGRYQLRRICDLWLELGRFNEAEQLAQEEVEQGRFLEFVKRLAWIKMVKGQVGAARVYLDVLRDNPIYGRWSEDRLERLQKDPDLSGDADIQRARSLMIQQEDIHLAAKPGSRDTARDRQLLSLLERNPHNRMAFEYLMALCMVSGNGEAFVAELPRVRDFSYPATPTLYEEAAVVWGVWLKKIVRTDTGAVVNGWPISSETVERFRLMEPISRSCHGLRNPQAQAAVARILGGTYFYYSLYGPEAPP